MLTVKAPAKINWFLKVLGRRHDGYHDIQSLMQKITLCDELTFSLSDNLELSTDAPIPVEENLIYRAALLLKERYGIDQGASMGLKKNIPVGAGLGGGSSDAAAALVGLNDLWLLGLSREELSGAAAELGSDVSFFLHGALSFVYGRGEKVMLRKARKSLDILLVKPSFHVSTAWVYENFARLTKKVENVNNIEHFIRNIERAELSGIADVVSNDLESVTMNRFPAIAGIKDRLLKSGAVFSLMSGSGSAVFGVFGSREKAEEASHDFSEFWTAVVQTIIE